MRIGKSLAGIFGLGLLASAAFGGSGTITIDAAKKGPEVNPSMYGIFLEEINYGVDGGLYAEMVKNRAFEGNTPPEGGKGKFTKDPSGLPDWKLVQSGSAKGTIACDTAEPLDPATPHSLRIEVENATDGRIGVANGGYWGMSAVQGEKYNLSLWARCADGFQGPLSITLEDADGKACTEPARIEGIGAEWKQLKATLTATATHPRARLVIAAGSKGKVWLDMVSLMPAKTWHGLPLRPDIAQLIADLKPKFVRFPGGCVVEGYSPEDAYNWKWTVGAPEKRRECFNAWDYRRTHGVGMYEYMRFIEELKAQPMFVLFAGSSCVFRGCIHVPQDKFQWVVDNYTDYLEYALGPADSKWGKVRAEAGHPEPFEKPMIGIGNETWVDEYTREYDTIYKAIKAKYPDITTIACLDKPGMDIDLIDHHYYFSARWFLSTRMYDPDRYDRKKPKVYCGEVASPNDLTERGHNILAALAESAFMIHCEDNADAVRMISYAPLVANADYKDAPWHGCINFDTARVFATPSYYAQKMFSENTPTRMVGADVKFEVDRPETVAGKIGVEFRKIAGEVKDVRVEKDGAVLYASDFSKEAAGWEKGAGWSVKDGAMGVSDSGTALYGDPAWTNYSVSARVRINKVLDERGGEFYLRMATSKANDVGLRFFEGAKKCVIIGCDGGFGEKPVDLSPGEWHEVKVQIQGLHARAWIDGKLVQDIQMRQLRRFVAGAGLDAKTGEVVVKVVNTYEEPIKTALEFKDLASLGAEAQLTVLKGDSLNAKNTFDEPKKVIPITASATLDGSRLEHVFQPWSLTVIRVKAKAE